VSLEVGMAPRPRLKRQRKRVIWLILFMLVALAAAAYWYLMVKPSNEHVEPYGGSRQAIVWEGSPYKKPYLLEAEQVLLPYEFLKEHLDPAIYWDEPTQSVIVTTKDKVLRMQSGQLVAYLNKRPVSLQVPVKEVGGTRYIPLEPLEKLYRCSFSRNPETGVLLVEKEGYAVQQGSVVSGDEPVRLRLEATHRSPYVAELPSGESVDILGETDDWYRVLSSKGIAGYLPREAVSLTEMRQVSLDQPVREQPSVWKPLGKKINMTWEHVVKRNPDVAEIGPMPGVNVVSPTWFELKDGAGTLLNKADPGYVQWAHKRGYQVWGVVTNGFNPDWTQSVLSSYDKRENMIAQIVHYAHMYDLDGINIDFENVYVEDKERLVQFVREMTPYLHELGLTVSMDVTIKSDSDRWSRFYDRAALAKVVDYIAVMTYDEHWASSPQAGSVASLPWTERGLQGVLEEVPAEKLLLGVPFYTRLWKEVKQPDGSVKVTSKALSMARAAEWLRERKLTPELDEASGQLFVRYQDPADGAVYKMWLEDVTSMQKRIALVHKYNLAGVAAWRRGFEQPEIWKAIDDGLNRK
jgi:spore germination protein YaaH